MSRIRDITVLLLRFAPADPYGSARGLAATRTVGLVLLDTEDGVQGVGEVWAPPTVARAYLDLIKPFYLGRGVFPQRGAAHMVLAKLYHAGTQNRMTALLGCIGIAAHDAMGKLLKLAAVR